MKTYTIQTHEITQDKLNLDQMLALQELAEDKDMSLVDLLDMMKSGVNPMLSKLRKKEMIKPFFGIILEGSDKIDIGKIDGATVVDIIQDFFLFNDKLILKLTSSIHKLVYSILEKLKAGKSANPPIQSGK